MSRARASICGLTMMGFVVLAPGESAQGAAEPLATEVDVPQLTNLHVNTTTGIYTGIITSGEVTAVRPTDTARVPEPMALGAHQACLLLYRRGPTRGLYPGVNLYRQRKGHTDWTLATWGGVHTTFTPAGRWRQAGIVSVSIQPGEKIAAKGGFWDASHQNLRLFESTKFKYREKQVVVNCYPFTKVRTWPF